jgi:hypothetical protein
MCAVRFTPKARVQLRVCTTSLQSVLAEAANWHRGGIPTSHWSTKRKGEKANANLATLALARKHVAYVKGVDRGQRALRVSEVDLHLVLLGKDNRIMQGAACQVLANC